MEELLTLRVPQALTKSAAIEAGRNLIATVEDGWTDPLQVLAGLTYMETALKEAKDKIKEFALKEAEKYEGKDFSAHGVNFQVKELGVKYDFSQNKSWADLEDNINILKAQQKGLETELKALKACAKSSTTGVVCILPK